MTELYINGIKVVLPKGFSTTVKTENPYFTKRGEYTYDVKLLLDNKINCELYNFLNRLNNKTQVGTKRTALLIANNRAYVRGTEIVTGWNDKEVTLQLVAGNSELNYLIGADLPISFLKMGKAEYIYGSDGKTGDYNNGEWGEYDNIGWLDLFNLTKTSAEYDYVLAPVYDKLRDNIVNNWGIANTNNTWLVCELRTTGYANHIFTPQPYLVNFLEKVLKALNYTIGTNYLRETVFSKIYIVHTIETNEYSKMLPGWSVKDFISELEKLCNIQLEIDNKTRTINIIQGSNYFVKRKEVYINNVVDEYEVELDEDSETTEHNDCNIRYDLPENDYYRARQLNEGVLKACPIKELPTFKEVKEYLTTQKPTAEIIKQNDNGEKYIYSTESSTFYFVDEFSAIINNKDNDDEMLLNIVPAELVDKEIRIMENNKVRTTAWRLPSVEGGIETIEENSSVAVEELLKKQGTSSTAKTETKGKIFMAIYDGTKNPLNDLPCAYPYSFTDDVRIHNSNLYRIAVPGTTLRLNELKGKLYDSVYKIDKSRPITFHIFDDNVFPTNSIYNIRNRRYVCKEIEYTITEKGREKISKGIFFPIKISDEEAYKRWILTDGKWRDGAVWIDNGRWIDG